MKNFLCLAFLFVALSAFGANPSFLGFRGTNGIAVTTNPTTGIVLIGPASPLVTNANLVFTNSNGTVSNLPPVSGSTSNFSFSSSIQLTVDQLPLAQFQNKGTNVLWIGRDGAIEIGRSIIPAWNPDNNDSFASWHDTSKGEAAWNQFFLGSGTNSNTLEIGASEVQLSARSTGFSSLSMSTINTNGNGATFGVNLAGGVGVGTLLKFGLQWDFTDYALFNPAATATATPHLIDTLLLHTAGTLFDVRNKGTNKFSVTYDGRIVVTNVPGTGDLGAWDANGMPYKTNSASVVASLLTNKIDNLNGFGTNLTATSITGFTNDAFTIKASNGLNIVRYPTNNAGAYAMVSGTNEAGFSWTNSAVPGSATLGASNKPIITLNGGNQSVTTAGTLTTGAGISAGAGNVSSSFGNITAPNGSVLTLDGSIGGGTPSEYLGQPSFRPGVTIRSNGLFGWTTNTDANGIIDSAVYRKPPATVGTAAAVGVTNLYIDLRLAFGPSATTNIIAGQAGLVAWTNTATLEVMAYDGAGNITQISPHATDAPDWFYDDSDPFPQVLRDMNRYVKKVRWQNQSRLSSLMQRQLLGEDLSTLTAQQRTCTVTETYAEYKARTGIDLPASDWKTEQAAAQADYDKARLAEIQAVNAGATNVTVRPVADIKVSIPAWLDKRVPKVDAEAIK